MALYFPRCFQLLIRIPTKLRLLKTYSDALKFVDTSGDKDKNCLIDGHFCKPDIAAYNPGDTKRGKTDFSRIEVAIEVKPNKSYDPFVDVAPLDEYPAPGNAARVEADTSNGMDTLGQITTYATAHMAQQLRPWVFSVVICGNYARLVRWDRSGAVFTSRFNYKTSDHLKKFFTRYGDLDKGPRGVDTTITILDDEDQRVVAAKKGIGFIVRSGLWQPRFYEFQLDPHRKVVGYSPSLSTASLVGRATQPFIVWDSVDQKRRFLKDTWRIDAIETREGDVYQLLRSKQVPNIASVIWHGDVGEQQTLTSKLRVDISNTYKMRSLTSHKHYRLMLDKVGRPCMEYDDQFHFFTIIYHVMKGEHDHSPAFTS